MPGCEDSQSLQAHILQDDQKNPHLDMLLLTARNTLLQQQENDFRLLPQIIIPGGFSHDSYLAQNGGKIDYIHGEDVVEGLAKEKNSIGFILPDMGKEELFPTVIHDGALPRKTFSMGHAQDKRYYTECRKIRK